MLSRWILTVWTLDTFISDNEVGPSSRIHGCCALLQAKGGPLRIQDLGSSPPFSVHARGELGADSGSRIFPCSAPAPQGACGLPI
eukprot:scaffold61228_cov77-Phaeocystis_antarctica.AAC.1